MAGRPYRRSRQGARLSPNPAGAHFLADRRLIRQLTSASGIGPGDLVFDLGAGYGALTRSLAASGARVIAVELDPALAGRLRRRFAQDENVSVVETDLRRMPFPRREFCVVANPPFALTTLLCRKLLGGPATSLTSAELILEWGAAKWLTSTEPRDGELRRWQHSYDIELVRRVPAGCFSPSPASDAAYVRIRSRRARTR